MASAFLSADLEITPDVREDHAAYIGSWLRIDARKPALHFQPRGRSAARR
jgi:antirestriction protein ArdC